MLAMLEAPLKTMSEPDFESLRNNPRFRKLVARK
jgi:hypothetical protein